MALTTSGASAAATKNKCTSDLALEELIQYLKIVSSDLKSDPIKFWQINKNEFPLLSNLARTYLGSPASSIPSEQLF